MATKDIKEKGGNIEEVVWTRKQAAHVANVSERTILNWHKNEGMPVKVKGRTKAGWKISARDFVAWYIERELQKQMPAEDVKTLDRERLRLTSEQADEKALNNAESRGLVVLSDQVKDVLLESVAMFAAGLSGLPSRLANELAGVEDAARIRSILRSEFTAIREGYSARIRKLADTQPDSGTGSRSDDAPTSKGGRRVGKRKPAPAARRG